MIELRHFAQPENQEIAIPYITSCLYVLSIIHGELPDNEINLLRKEGFGHEKAVKRVSCPMAHINDVGMSVEQLFQRVGESDKEKLLVQNVTSCCGRRATIR